MAILKNLIELIESNKTNEAIEFLKNNINELSDKDLLNIYFKIINQENYHLLNSFFNLIKKEQLVKCINNSYINKIIINGENKKAIDNIYALLYFKENLHEVFINNIFNSSIQLKNTEMFNHILKNLNISNEYLAEKLKELAKDNTEENKQYISSIILNGVILPNDANLLSSLPPNIIKKNYIPHITFRNITEDTVEKIYEKIYTTDFKYSPNYIEIANLIVKDRGLSSSKKLSYYVSNYYQPYNIKLLNKLHKKINDFRNRHLILNLLLSLSYDMPKYYVERAIEILVNRNYELKQQNKIKDLKQKVKNILKELNVEIKQENTKNNKKQEKDKVQENIQNKDINKDKGTIVFENTINFIKDKQFNMQLSRAKDTKDLIYLIYWCIDNKKEKYIENIFKTKGNLFDINSVNFRSYLNYLEKAYGEQYLNNIKCRKILSLTFQYGKEIKDINTLMDIPMSILETYSTKVNYGKNHERLFYDLVQQIYQIDKEQKNRNRDYKVNSELREKLVNYLDLVCRKNDLYSKGEINIIVDSIKNENQTNVEAEVNTVLNNVTNELQRENELHVENNVEKDKEEEVSF